MVLIKISRPPPNLGGIITISSVSSQNDVAGAMYCLCVNHMYKMLGWETRRRMELLLLKDGAPAFEGWSSCF